MKWKTVRVCNTMKEAKEVYEYAVEDNNKNHLGLKIRIKEMSNKFAIQFYLPKDFEELGNKGV